MDRLPAEPAMLRAQIVSLPPAAARHLKVLRAKKGDLVELFDGEGAERAFEVCGDGTLSAAGELRVLARPSAPVVLYACVTKGSRWDWTVEKAVELGVSRIVPVISERTIVRLGAGGEREAKAERWRRVALDAARQSHAVWLPRVEAPVDFAGAVADMASVGIPVFGGFLRNPPPPPLLEAAETVAAARGLSAGAGVFTGPEGDFTSQETAALEAAGVVPVSLGPTVLRAETAAICALAVLAARLQAAELASPATARQSAQ